MKRRIVGGVMASALVVGGAVWATDDQPKRAVCQEDEECWNCLTMGNQECGVNAHLAAQIQKAIGDRGEVLMNTETGVIRIEPK